VAEGEGFSQTFYTFGAGLKSEPWVGSTLQPWGNPAVIYSTNDSQQHLFYKILPGGIAQTFYDPSRGLVHDEVWLPTYDVREQAIGDLATMFSSDIGQQHVFWRGPHPEHDSIPGGIIWHIYYDPRNGGQLLGPEGWAAGAMGDPAVMFTPSNNQQHVFYRGQDDQGQTIEDAFWDPSRGLVAETWVGNAAAPRNNATRPAADPSCLFTPEGDQHVFYEGVDNEIHYVHYDSNIAARFYGLVLDGGG
jgi:hypothetical protein